MSSLPTFIVVGGTCGSGKSTIAKEVATRLGYDFEDGDDYHSEQNKAKMAKGVALNDAERMPWLQNLARLATKHSKLVVACSALKRMYRDLLISESGRDINQCRVFMLKVSRCELEKRLDSRPDHFVKGDLLDSQLRALELPVTEENGDEAELYLRVIDADGSPEEVVGAIVRELEGCRR